MALDLAVHNMARKKSKQLKSNQPLPVIKFPIDESQYEKIEGTLETYYETGMECIGLILYDKTKLFPNEQFDPSKPEGGLNFPFFKDYSGTHFFKTGDLLQVGQGDIWGLVKDPEFAANDQYHLSFYPCGLTKEEWVSLFISEKIEATLWKKKSV